MKFSLNSVPTQWKVAAQLSAFGYGRPGCRVWRYWDDRPPVRTTGAPVKTLLLAHGGRAMMILTSFGPAGEVNVSLDRSVLGLSDDAAAVNVETGEPIDRTGLGQFKLFLPRHDFRVLRVERPKKSQKGDRCIYWGVWVSVADKCHLKPPNICDCPLCFPDCGTIADLTRRALSGRLARWIARDGTGP
jgi:hypothetical protein